MTTVSPKEASRRIRGLLDRLEASDGLRDVFAQGTLEAARDKASGKPTPQARMAAEALIVQHGQVLSLSEGPPGEVLGGSEFGSSIYRQFGPRNTRGYWLLPSVEVPDAGTMSEGEDWVDDQIKAAVHGF